MTGYFELKPATTGFVFNLRAANHEVILSSEFYTAKPGALNVIESVKRNALDDARFEHKKANDGSPYGVLKATNGGS
jgi:uncharacterized protein YegP (UPF0339 family)